MEVIADNILPFVVWLVSPAILVKAASNTFRVLQHSLRLWRKNTAAVLIWLARKIDPEPTC